MTKYPSLRLFAGLGSESTRTAIMWDIGTLVYSGDIAGAAEFLAGKGYRRPERRRQLQPQARQQASTWRARATSSRLQEVNRAARMNVSLGERKASAAKPGRREVRL
jgi:hypothetical protein